ncbi:hypothetical protein EON64_12020 [archaeon]|nr:MAG: hypothetical protein EON64_12020 [archaeon]
MFWRDNARFDEQGNMVTTDTHYLEDPFLKYLPDYTKRQGAEMDALSAARTSQTAPGKISLPTSESMKQTVFVSQVSNVTRKIQGKLHARSATVGLLVGSAITYATTLF